MSQYLCLALTQKKHFHHFLCKYIENSTEKTILSRERFSHFHGAHPVKTLYNQQILYEKSHEHTKNSSESFSYVFLCPHTILSPEVSLLQIRYHTRMEHSEKETIPRIARERNHRFCE